MKIDSLAFKTDLFFHRFNGIVLEFEDYLVVQTPTNPCFFWGNLLYFKKPPTLDSFKSWQTLFNKHFQKLSVNHMTFSWDSHLYDLDFENETDLMAHFQSEGFELEQSIVMVAEKIVVPPKIFPSLKIAPIDTETEWEMVIANQVRCRAPQFEEKAYRLFTERRMASYRLMIKQGKGEWLGAFYDEILVGDLGIFVENGVGRFQVVSTHPDYRRLGVCSTLVYNACLFATENLNATHFVMVADPEYHAAKIYESIGFTPTQKQIGLCKYDKSRWAT
jgi:GNAT superfamily N-acetyltransferase